MLNCFDYRYEMVNEQRKAAVALALEISGTKSFFSARAN